MFARASSSAGPALAAPSSATAPNSAQVKNDLDLPQLILDGNLGITPHRSPSPQPQHRRGYQACDPCRKRKVKCDLGSVDNPRPPPCVRCRRESKRCEFSATRRKRKVSEDIDDGKYGDDGILCRDKRKMGADGSAPVDSPLGNYISSSYPYQSNDTNGSNNGGDNHNANHYNEVSSSLATSGPPGQDWKGPSAATPRLWTDSSPALPERGSSSSSILSSMNRPSNYGGPPPHPVVSSADRFQSQPAHSPPTALRPDSPQVPRAFATNSVTNNGLLTIPTPAGPDGGQHMMNKTAAELLSPAISNTTDALHLLSEAAGRSEDLNRQHMERYPVRQSSTSTFGSGTSPAAAAGLQTGSPGKSVRSNSSTRQKGWYNPGAEQTNMDGAFDVHEAAMISPKSPVEDVEYTNAVRAWSRLRFIRAGWFSVEEAMAYIAYYYDHLAPLSPIVPPNFSSPATHVKLLTEEPVLTVTMLTVASRHMPLTGNGANSRAYSIHEKLWSYLRGMIERLVWGQEGFRGSVLPSNPSSSKSREFGLSLGPRKLKGHLRSLGTVEALLLLTDWHPRALHFPPGDDENTLLDMDGQLLSHLNGYGKEDDNTANIQPNSNNNQNNNYPEPFTSKGQSGGSSEGRLAFHRWLEPVWRSDRMSWMLLSTAQALAFELGIFDQKNELRGSTEPSAERARRRRLRRMILVYVSQSSGRLGIPSMLPLPQWNQNGDFMSDSTMLLSDFSEDFSIDLLQECWMGISNLMYFSNVELFPTKEETSNMIKSGQYRERIDEFMQRLREFKQKFDRISMSPHMRNILTIEYEYTRVYINSLALQAVVDRWTTMNNEASASRLPSGTSGSAPSACASASGTAPLRLLMEQYQVNEPYIQAVVDASRKILHIVLDGLVPGGHLQHVPVRTFFRVLSAMIFILKTFTLGAKEDDVRISLELQDRTIECLRTCVVDDVHLSVTIADLLHLLTANIRTRFLRFVPFDRAGDCSSRERTPLPTSPLQSSHPSIERPASQGNATHHQHQTDQQQHQGQSSPGVQSPRFQQHFHKRNTSNGSSHRLQYDGEGLSFQPRHNTINNSVNHHRHSSSSTSGIPHISAPTAAPVPPATYHDPLASIPAQPIDPSNLNVSFMPPPASVYYNYYDPSLTGTSPKMELDDHPTTITPDQINNSNNNANSTNTGPSGNTLSDWFALPLDQFFNSSTAAVDQGLGGTGPMVGEFDMLEVLLKEQYTGDINNANN